MANTKYKIKGNNKIPNYDSELEIDVDDKYEAYSKTIPADTPYQDKHITWFNCFGVKDKATGKDADVEYKVTLQVPPQGRTLYTQLPGSPPSPLPIERVDKDKIKFTLNVGDPPTGYYP